MLQENATVPADEVKRLADKLRAARAANPNNPTVVLLQRRMDQAARLRRKIVEAEQRIARLPNVDAMRRRLHGDHVVSGEPVKPVEPVTRTRKRKPTLAGVARQAARARIEVARYDVRPDGTIGVVTGKPVATSDNDMDDTTPIDRSEWN